ncbi:MAG TPA: FtsX-like permease family protein, partial [Vicinamibacterales bacterium]|nr:FtsX-like permease family protein [Vicinamibacterales bacterium]
TFAAFVSQNYFETLGVPLARGRSFTADESRPGSAVPVAIASHVFWRRMGSDPGLVGRTILVNEQPLTIVGIAPDGFTGTMMVFGPELFFPLGVVDTLHNDFAGRGRALASPDAFDLFLVGRLAPAVSLATVPSRLPATAQAVTDAYPGQYRDRQLSVAALPRFSTGPEPSDESAVASLALVFLGLTGAVLLIVCLNLATVLVARGETRRREFAIRLALGGGRFRIVRQLMLEALALGLAGAAGGVLLGLPAIDALLTALLSRLPVSLTFDIDTTWATVVGAVGFGALAAVLFALGPALAHSRRHALTDLKHQLSDDAPTARRRFLPRHALVALQVALSLALLVTAGLFVRQAREGTDLDVAARAGDTVLVDVDAGLAGYDEARALPAYAALEARLAAMPGVEAASLGVTIPFGFTRHSRPVRRAGTRPGTGERPVTPEAGRSFTATWNAVGRSYPQAMGLALLRGRVFTDGEALRAGAPPVALVDDVLAGQLWPDGDAVGQSIHIGAPPESEDAPPQPAVQIVGIVSRLNGTMFSKAPKGAVYVPFAQGYRAGVYFHVRPRPGTGAALMARVRQELHAAMPALPVFGATTLAAHLASSLELWQMKALALAMTAVGAFAALIALMGVYGSKAYAVARRSREIGVRLAVGATPAGVARMIVGEALRVAVVGVAAGTVLGLGMGRVLAAVFADIAAFDWLIFTSVPAALVAACVVAAWVPARRAAAVDPAQVLRGE